jgi:hypothetical protein
MKKMFLLLILIPFFSQAEDDIGWTLIDLGVHQHVAYLLQSGPIETFDSHMVLTERIFDLDTEKSTYFKLVVPMNGCSQSHSTVEIWNEQGDKEPDVEVMYGSGHYMTEILRRACQAFMSGNNL